MRVNDFRSMLQHCLCEGGNLLQVTSGAAVCFFGLLAACRRKLPSMQVRVASGPACLTGLLWSIGNFLSIYAVQVSPPHPHASHADAPIPHTMPGLGYLTSSGSAQMGCPYPNVQALPVGQTSAAVASRMMWLMAWRLCAVLRVESGLAAGSVPAGGVVHVGSPLLQGGEQHACICPQTSRGPWTIYCWISGALPLLMVGLHEHSLPFMGCLHCCLLWHVCRVRVGWGWYCKSNILRGIRKVCIRGGGMAVLRRCLAGSAS